MAATQSRCVEGVRLGVVATYLAAKDRRTPWLAKILVIAATVYYVVPWDVLPNTTLIGYLDEVVLLPLALVCAAILIPPDLRLELVTRAKYSGPSTENLETAVGFVLLMSILVAQMIWDLLSSSD